MNDSGVNHQKKPIAIMKPKPIARITNYSSNQIKTASARAGNVVAENREIIQGIREIKSDVKEIKKSPNEIGYKQKMRRI